MRLSKKIAAVALAAVMTVSMMTACGSTGGPSSSGSSSAGSNSSSNSSSNSNSDSNSSSDSSSNSNSNSASNGDSEGKNETIAYEKSRSAKFYQKIETGSYTMNETVQVEINGQGTNIKMAIDYLVSTDGKRAYVKQTFRMEDEDQTQTELVDLTTKDKWVLFPYQKPMDDKLGYYTTGKEDRELQNIISPVNPAKGHEFKQETKGNYYIETQTVEYSAVTDVCSFVYEGNSSVPEYGEIKKYDKDGTQKATFYVEYSNFKNQAEEKYLDFASILANYNKSNSTSTTQALEPSIASLTIG